MNKIDLIDAVYNEWGSSTRGPCNCWHGAGCDVRASYVGADGKTYKLVYSREFPGETTYMVAPADALDAVESFGSLKASAKSPHIPAFRALLAFAKAKGCV